MNKKTLILLVFSGMAASILLVLMNIMMTPEAQADEPIVFEAALDAPIGEKMTFVQENSILSSLNPSEPLKRVKMVITAYSSTSWQTDDTPFITASGSEVKDGIVANNLLPFGTKVKIPDLYGDKIFVVEDRMSSTKSNYHLDVWFPEYEQALNFGAKLAYVVILEN